MKKIALIVALAGLSVSLFAQDIKLPAPVREGGKPLMDCLNSRQSVRTFDENRGIDNQTLSNLLWAAWGYNREDKRTAPSSRNKQEIDLYVALASGVYCWDAKANVLKQVTTKDLRKETGMQPFVEKAPLNIIYVCNKTKADAKTPQLLTEATYANAGFISQNVYLFCASEGLGTVIRGSVPKDELSKLLHFTSDQLILLAQSVGYPAK